MCLTQFCLPLVNIAGDQRAQPARGSGGALLQRQAQQAAGPGAGAAPAGRQHGERGGSFYLSICANVVVVVELHPSGWKDCIRVRDYCRIGALLRARHVLCICDVP